MAKTGAFYFLLLGAMIGAGQCITCYNCHYNDQGEDRTSCATISETTPFTDCDTLGNATVKLNACIETVSSRIDNKFAINRGCTLFNDLHCSLGNPGEAIYCCQGDDLCNNKPESELAGTGHHSEVAVVLLVSAVLLHWM